jgi:hypothetical protein
MLDRLRAIFGHTLQVGNSAAIEFVLFDRSTGIVLAVSPFIVPIIFLSKNTRDSAYVGSYIGDEIGHERLNSPLPRGLTTEEYPEWSWRFRLRRYEKTPPAALTEEIRARSRLAQAKAKVITTMMMRLSAARNSLRSVDFQETVYAAKRAQAIAFRESGYDERRLAEFPYVAQYAEIAGVSGRQATDDILFAAQLTEEILVRTERVRLTYFRKVAEAKTVEELPELLKGFSRELIANSLA